MIVFGATLMKDAPNHPATTTANGVVENDFTLAESMRKPQYWMLAVMFLTACMSGLYVIGVAKDIAQGMVHLDVATAANAVTVISIANPERPHGTGHPVRQDLPYPRDNHRSGGVPGRYGGPAVRPAECNDLLCGDCLRGL